MLRSPTNRICSSYHLTTYPYTQISVSPDPLTDASNNLDTEEVPSDHWYIHTLYTHNIYTIYTLYTHNIYTIYTLYIHYIYTIYTLYIHYIYTIFTLCIHYIYTIYTL